MHDSSITNSAVLITSFNLEVTDSELDLNINRIPRVLLSIISKRWHSIYSCYQHVQAKQLFMLIPVRIPKLRQSCESYSSIIWRNWSIRMILTWPMVLQTCDCHFKLFFLRFETKMYHYVNVLLFWRGILVARPLRKWCISNTYVPSPLP